MEVAHEIEDRQTPLEKRYLPFISEIRDPGAKYQIAKEISGSVPERSSEHRPKLQEMIDPHQGFIESYNTRAAAEHRQKMKSKSQELYNENGQRYGRVWDYEGFKNVHDPLNIFEKKGNYEDLAWKVYGEVEDSNVYLKTLYFPKLTSNDVHFLFDKFEEEYKSLSNKKRFAYVLSLGSLFGTWALAYTYKFKFYSFLATSALAFAATKCSLDKYAQYRMGSNLNNVAEEISKKYPEIKYSRIQYVKSSEISPKKLI